MHTPDTAPTLWLPDSHTTQAETVSARIARLESDLAIHSPEDAILEAMLLIDPRFIETAGLLAMGEEVKYFFGDLEWANHLEARKYAREYGNKPLSPEFVLNLHQIHLQGGPHEGQPSIGTSKDPRGSAYVNGQHVPFRCSDEEIAALNSNPRLTWSAIPENPHLGIIRYNVKTREDRYADLQSICNWYNAQPPDTRELFVRGSGVQHKLISWHGLGYDYNGRVMRDVLNWSVENDFGLGCALADFDGDLFVTEEEWQMKVTFGVIRYAWSKRRKQEGVSGADIIPGVYEKRPYYEKYLAGVIDVPTFQGGGVWQDHEPFDRFIALVQLYSRLNQWPDDDDSPSLGEITSYCQRYQDHILRHCIEPQR